MKLAEVVALCCTECVDTTASNDDDGDDDDVYDSNDDDSDAYSLKVWGVDFFTRNRKYKDVAVLFARKLCYNLYDVRRPSIIHLSHQKCL